MKKWQLSCSIDGINIDHEEVIYSDTEPDFWTCYEIAKENGCDYFTITELED